MIILKLILGADRRGDPGALSRAERSQPSCFLAPRQFFVSISFLFCQSHQSPRRLARIAGAHELSINREKIQVEAALAQRNWWGRSSYNREKCSNWRYGGAHCQSHPEDGAAEGRWTHPPLGYGSRQTVRSRENTGDSGVWSRQPLVSRADLRGPAGKKWENLRVLEGRRKQ